jgi:hypothetical protein
VPFYLKWISDCHSFLNELDSQILNIEQKKHFLKHLSKTHEEWQVKQADSALRLYSYSLSFLQKNTSAKSPDVEVEGTCSCESFSFSQVFCLTFNPLLAKEGNRGGQLAVDMLCYELIFLKM